MRARGVGGGFFGGERSEGARKRGEGRDWTLVRWGARVMRAVSGTHLLNVLLGCSESSVAISGVSERSRKDGYLSRRSR